VIRFSLSAMILLTSTTAIAAPAPDDKIAEGVTADGVDVRIETEQGAIHVFRPTGYDRATAGSVVYVHGYFTHVDDAWREHKLAAQFAASRRNALFIVPEAPSGSDEASIWTSLRRLIAAAIRGAQVRKPTGPVIVIGHSGAYRSILPWLKEPIWHNLILVDALYGNERDFRAWLDRNRANRMTLAVKGTAKWADPFVRALPYAVRARRIPKTAAELSRAQRDARVLSLRSQYGHFELITEGKTLPVLLGRSGLPLLKRSARAR
jgi:hypothetical protein